MQAAYAKRCPKTLQPASRLLPCLCPLTAQIPTLLALVGAREVDSEWHEKGPMTCSTTQLIQLSNSRHHDQCFSNKILNGSKNNVTFFFVSYTVYTYKNTVMMINLSPAHFTWENTGCMTGLQWHFQRLAAKMIEVNSLLAYPELKKIHEKIIVPSS